MRNEDEKLREAARMLSANCDRHSTGCKGCLFCRDELYCKINGIPIAWDNDFEFGDHFREVTKKPKDQFAEVRNMVDDHSANTGKKVGDRCAELSKAIGAMVGTPTDTPTAPVAPTDTPTDTPNTRAEILDAAKKIVTGDREKQYGKPEDNFAVIAEFWTTYIGHPISSEDVAIMMALLKIARIRSGNYKADSFVDGVGYLSLAAEIAGR